MKLSLLDFILATVSGLFILLPAFLVSWKLGQYVCVTETSRVIFQVVLFFSNLYLFSTIILWVLRRICPLSEGSVELGTEKQAVVWKLQGFLYLFNLGLFINSYIAPVNLKGFLLSLLGMKIGRCVMIGGKVFDPALIEIGDSSILGEDTLLTAHAIEGNKMELGKIKIGRGVTIGVKAVVLPNVEIGDHSIVAAASVVKKGTRILPGEIWGGIPATKIREVKI